MFDISVKIVDKEGENGVLKKNINLDVGLDAFVLVSSSNNDFADNVLNYTIEHLIDKISKEDTYHDFSIALENINAFIKTWRSDVDNRVDTLDMVIGILNEDLYTFSNIGSASAYLLNKSNEVIELTEKDEDKKEFSYISSGKLLNGEIVISATIPLLNYLSKSDLLDGLILADDIEIFNKNIVNILEGEILEENVIVSSLKISNGKEEEDKESKLGVAKEYAMKALDNKFSKSVIGGVLFVTDKIKARGSIVKNISLVAGILIGIVLLYSLLSTFVNNATQTEMKDEMKQKVLDIRDLLQSASENVNNDSVFERNISDAEKLVKEVQAKNLYLNDLAKITDDLNLLKQQFNKIEIFNESDKNLIHALDSNMGVKIVKIDTALYVVDSKAVIGPIVTAGKPQIYTFSNLGEKESFVDGAVINQNLYLLTNNSKIVRFTTNGYFEYVSTIGQNTWEDMRQLGVYASNLYTLGQDNQLYKHAPSSTNFGVAQAYLKEEDVTQIGKILSIAVDGGFYILKEDLSMVKFFSSPYRLESLTLSKLPKNYNVEDGNSRIELKASNKLNYVYLLMNNKIFVFKPNTTLYSDTRDLTYLGQIEGATKRIKDFFVNYDGELIILNDAGVYKLNFEISNDRIVIR